MLPLLFLSPPEITIENPELRVLVDQSSGRIQVVDKAVGLTWQSVVGDIHEFAQIQRKADRIRFKTDFGSLSAWVELRLPKHSRNLTVKLEADPAAKTDGFDFLPPFQPRPGCSLAVADYTDGHMYPCSIDKWPLYNLDQIHVNALDMPWIGVFDSQSGAGYSVMVDTPFDATFRCVKTEGQRSPWIRWEPEKGRFGYQRSLTYHFTARGGYVEEAKAFRNRTELGRLKDKARRNPNITKLYGAPEIWDFNDLVSDRELKALGVERCVHHVQDWSAHGDAVREANRLGFVTQDYDYYLDSHPVSPEHPYLSGTSGRGYYGDMTHVVVGADGKYRGEGDWWDRCPIHYRTVGERIIPARLAKFPTTAIYFDQLTADYLGVADGPFGGGSVQECFSPNHPLSRKEWAGAVRGFLQYVTNLGVIPAAEHGKWWEVPFTSIFYGIPSVQWPWPDVTFPAEEGSGDGWNYYRTWGTVSHTNRIPLWQLVFHDSAISMWYPWDVNDVTVNIPGDWMQEMKDASSVLYGVPAGFMVTDAGTGSWFRNRQKFLASYRNTAKVHEALADKEMVSHSFLSANRDVQETRWSDGSRVVVNFGDGDYRVDGLVLKRFGWCATGPWGNANKVWDPSLDRVVTTIDKENYSFTDRESWKGRSIAMATTRIGNDRLRVNVDEVPATPLRLALPLTASKPRIFRCDPKSGERGSELKWEFHDRWVVTEPLTGWVVLDVLM